MKIDMSPEAITLRLKQVAQLRRACLELARSTSGGRIRKQHPEHPLVQRTAAAVGRELSPFCKGGIGG